MIQPFNALGLAHHFLRSHVKPGDFCIDATAGRGRDTALLCELTGSGGRVAALDIQQDALTSTAALLSGRGLLERARLILDSHANLSTYFSPSTADVIVFNLGWLPGSDHSIRTTVPTTIAALNQSLTILKPGGVMSICVYYGGISGYEERDAVLEWAAQLDSRRYTSLLCSFSNRSGDPPIPLFLFKDIV